MPHITVSNDLQIAMKELKKRFPHDNAAAEVIWEMIRCIDESRKAAKPTETTH